jgi:hypothetical protein
MWAWAAMTIAHIVFLLWVLYILCTVPYLSAFPNSLLFGSMAAACISDLIRTIGPDIPRDLPRVHLPDRCRRVAGVRGLPAVHEAAHPMPACV